ncbi:MAG TPA: hypothetical protein VJM12_10335 [Pyrinomonadaceae bacterium]|nr:hypothetical protein [Pyrinomonadaceae bacterium]
MKKIIYSLAFALLVIGRAQGQMVLPPIDLDGLHGLSGVNVRVNFARDEVLGRDKRSALQKVLQDDVEARFIKAGVPLVRFAQEIESTPGSPRFQIEIVLDKPNGHVYPVVTQSNLFQKVRLSRDSSIELTVSTWGTYTVGNYDIGESAMLKAQVGAEADQFIKDYLKQNPKPAVQLLSNTGSP